MNATLTDLPREHWQQLIDWAGQVCADGADADRARRRPPRPGAARAADARDPGRAAPLRAGVRPAAAARRHRRRRLARRRHARRAVARAGAVDEPEGAARAGRAPRPLPLLRRAAAGGRRDRAAPTAPGRSSSCCGGCARATCAEPGRPRAQAGGWSALPAATRRRPVQQETLHRDPRPAVHPVRRLQTMEATLDRALAHAARDRDLLVAQPAPHQLQRRQPARG